MGMTKKINLLIRRKRNKMFLSAWHVKSGTNKTGYGKPSAENLKAWAEGFNASCRPGGANEHLGINGTINYAIEIYSQITGEVLAEYNPPMFQII